MWCDDSPNSACTEGFLRCWDRGGYHSCVAPVVLPPGILTVKTQYSVRWPSKTHNKINKLIEMLHFCWEVCCFLLPGPSTGPQRAPGPQRAQRSSQRAPRAWTPCNPACVSWKNIKRMPNCKNILKVANEGLRRKSIISQKVAIWFVKHKEIEQFGWKPHN